MHYEGIVAGLGNPGRKYEATRHNMGFMFIDVLLELCAREGEVQVLNGKKFQSELWAISIPQLEGKWLAAKPLTFMNDSGIALKPLLAWHDLKPDELVVVQDEMDLPAGELRFKFGGGLAGHNGLLSISRQLGTQDFYRLRIGIGKPALRDNTLNWVLGRQSPEDQAKIKAIMPYAIETLFIYSREGQAPAVQYAHTAAKLIAAAALAQDK